MPLLVNLRHLEAHSIRLVGQLPVKELDIETHDEAIKLAAPLEHDFEVQKLEDSILVQGSLRLALDCQCVRCLKPFPFHLALEAWTLHLPFKGEEAVTVSNDCVDLTPYAREDILLEFPQHPLCNPECRGLPATLIGKPKKASAARQTEENSSAWAELNKLKLES
jgi:uncharacterized protein